MSKRKQRKPQHRKTIEKLEEPGDSLTCGDCHVVFSLCDITQFIQHKVRKCDKENINPSLVDNCNNSSDEENDDDQEGDDTKETVLSSRCSISAPIAGRRGTPELRGGLSPRPALASIIPGKGNEDDVPRGVTTPKRVDAESNTSLSEPTVFRCCSCSVVCNSAWSLLQHVQSYHHMRIYIETKSATLSLPCQSNGNESLQLGHEQKLDNSRDEECSNGDYDDAFEDDEESKEEDKSKDKVDVLADNINTANNITAKNGASSTNPFMSSIQLPPDRPMHHSSPFNSSSYPPEHLRFGFHHPHIGLGFPPPPGLENPPHSAFPNPFDRTKPPFMSNFEYDLYSKRLQKLAEVKALPTMQLPIQKHAMQPISNHSNSSPPASSPSKPSPSESGQRTPGSAASHSPVMAGPSKLRKCEFCGKSFKFQSNLIVHRRSHTGEKPFNCPLCSHACTQASKLKRHMKTHQKSSGGWSSNMSNDSSSHRSDSSSPNSEKAADIIAQRFLELGELDSDNELESGAEEEEEEDVSDQEKKSQPSNSTRDTPNAERSKWHGSSSTNKECQKEGCETDQEKSTNLSTGEGSQKYRSDKMFHEVVEHSELLQQHHDTLCEALAEKDKTRQKSDSCGESNDGKKYDSKRQESATSYENGEGTADDSNAENKQKPLRPPPELLDYGSRKRIKTENRDPSPQSMSQQQQLQHSIEHHPFYPNLWFPQYSPAHRELLSNILPFPSREMANGYPVHGESPFSINNRRLQSGNSTPTSPAVSIANAVGLPHTGPRREKRSDTCEFCGKVFKNCSNLTVHRRSHTGEKPYKCTLCSYACAQSSKLTRHMRTHGRIGKDSFYCKFCNTPFSVPSTLEKHMRKCVESQQKISLHNQHPALSDVRHQMNDIGRIASATTAPVIPSESMVQ